jgi:hypothetical protein
MTWQLPVYSSAQKVQRVATRLDMRRHECRRGMQECVRHGTLASRVQQ